MPLFLSTMLVTGAVAAEPANQVELRDALARAAQRPAVEAARERAAAADESAQASARVAYWPQLAVTAFDSHTNNLPVLTTPFGALRLGDYDQRGGTVQLRQPLLQWSKSSAAMAERLAADAEQDSLARAVQLNVFAAASRYLDVLTIESQLRAVTALQTSLDDRLRRLRGEEAVGRVLHADVLKVQVTLDEAAQQIVSLQQRLLVARQDLAHALGQESAPEPRELGALPDSLRLTAGAGVPAVAPEAAAAARGDVLALEAQARSLRERASGTLKQAWPTLDAVADYDRSRGIASAPDHETRFGVVVSWPVFAGGAYSKEASADRHKARALDEERIELERRVVLEARQAEADYATAASVRDLARSAIASARETLDTRNALYGYGRATIDEVLNAEADLSQQVAVLETARLGVVRAWFAFQLAVGHDLAAALDAEASATEKPSTTP